MAINTQNTVPDAFGPLITLQENWDKLVIADWETTKYTSSLYQDYPMEAFPMFQGPSQKFGIWRQGLSHVMGLADFTDVTQSRAPGTNGADDPGVSACDDYTPKVLSFGGQEIWHNELKRALLASPAICVNDLRQQTEAPMQIKLRVDFFMKQTKEYGIAYRRENAIKAIIRANHGFLMNTAPLDTSLTTTDNHFYYDPDTLVDGVPCAYYKAGDEIEPINIDVLINANRWLQAQCPDGATGSVDGMPSFTWYGDAQDLENAIRQDPAAREDMRYAEPNMLMGSFRKFRSYRGITIAHDLCQMRFKEVGIVDGTNISNGRGGTLGAGNWVRCARVSPERESDRTGLDGFAIVEANPEWFQASIRLMPAIMNNVMTIQVGSKLENIAGMTFGPQPGYNGEVKFLVFPENPENPFGEKGAFFCRYELGIKPGKNYMNSIGYLYRSCVTPPTRLCATDGTVTSATHLAANAAAADVDDDNYTATVTLVSALKATIGDQVTVVTAIAGSVTGYILDIPAEKQYVLGFTSTVYDTFHADAHTEFTTAATVAVA